MTTDKPKKPTRQQREILLLVRDTTVRRYMHEKWTRTGSTVTFYWAADCGAPVMSPSEAAMSRMVDRHGGSRTSQPGPELSERVIDTLTRNGWVESRRPDRKPTSLRDMMAWQCEATLHLTDAGRAIL